MSTGQDRESYSDDQDRESYTVDNSWIKELHNGDQIYWTDPDNGLCSRHLIIREIKIIDTGDSDPVVQIWALDGDYLEAYASELS